MLQNIKKVICWDNNKEGIVRLLLRKERKEKNWMDGDSIQQMMLS